MTYIILHHIHSGEEIIINPKAIQSVYGSTITLDGHWFEVKESYQEIKEIIFAWAKVESDTEVSQDWFRSLHTKDKEKIFKYISEKCRKCGEQK